MVKRLGLSRWLLGASLSVACGGYGCDSDVGPEPVQQVVQHAQPGGPVEAGASGQAVGEQPSEEELTSRDLEAELNRLERQLQQ